MSNRAGIKIDVHGMTVAQAEAILRVNLAGFCNRGYNEVFIIHGKGQGRLRAAVRKLLSRLYFVRSGRRGGPHEGGDGVTVAVFR